MRVEVTQGTNEAVAVDELIDDLLHNDVNGALRALHEPYVEGAPVEGRHARARPQR